MAINVTGAAVAETPALEAKAAAVAAYLNAAGVAELRIFDGGVLMLTFVLNDPEFTSSGVTWVMNLTPAVQAIVEAGHMNGEADTWQLFAGDGALAYSGTCTSSFLTTGDVTTVNSWIVTEGN